MAPTAFRIIGQYLNSHKDRLVVAEVHISGSWTIKGGGHLFAPVYASGTEAGPLDAIRAAAEALEWRYEADGIKGDMPRDLRWHIDIDKYRMEA